MTERRDPLLDSTANARLLAAIRVGIGVVALLRGAGLVMKALGTGQVDVLSMAGIALWFGLALLVVVGWRARLAAALLAGLWFGLIVHQGELFYANHSYLISLALLLVSFSDCERHYALRARGSGDAPGWPLVLMRWQVSIVYAFAGLAKINEEFLSGQVLTLYISEAIVPFASAVASWPSGFVVLLSAMVVAVELFLALALWFGRLRPVAFGLALPLHLGMLVFSGPWLTFYEIIVYGLTIFVLFAAFLSVPAQGRLVVWDDSCSFCRQWITGFRRLDAFGGFRFLGASSPAAYGGTGVTPEAAAEAMQLVEPDGRVRTGWTAVQGVVSVLPGGYLLAPYMSLPLIRQIGERVYRRVAASRTCAYVPAGVVAGRD